MHKLISTLVYLEGDFIKRNTCYHFGDTDNEIMFGAVCEAQRTITNFITLAGNRGECTIGDILKTPKEIDGSYSFYFSAEINRQRYTFYVQVADTSADTI